MNAKTRPTAKRLAAAVRRILAWPPGSPLGPALPARTLQTALDRAVADLIFRDPALSPSEAALRLLRNGNELPVFLYRLGREAFLQSPADPLLDFIHGAMRRHCSCEIYFSNDIGVGLQIVHGLGTVVGSRNVIGPGFRIYQGCTVGHRSIGEAGARIGAGVTLYANSSVLGAVTVGDGAVIGAHSLVLSDVHAGAVMAGSPALPVRNL
jgi:serine O-acetyltransferase